MDRTGTGTLSVFGRQIRHKMSEGFPLLTTKKMAFKTMVTELLWFLRGETNIKYLVDNNCHIWDGDCYQSYISEKAHPLDGKYGDTSVRTLNHMYPYEPILSKEEFINKIKTDDEFAKKWGELGKIYGSQWRKWGSDEILVEKSFGDDEGFGYKRKVKVQTKGVDQISELIEQLKDDPDSRRLLVSAWNPADLPHQVLPPCHYGFQVYTRELSFEERFNLYNQVEKIHFEECTMSMLDTKNIPTRAISLQWSQRSVDTFLGLPFNIASYGLLLEIIAKAVNMVPDELIGNLGDVHLYSNHIEQAKEQIGRELTYKARYDIWFESNYQTGMEYNLEVEQDFNNNVGEDYMIVPPTKTREPFPLPKLKINSGNENWHLLDINEIINSLDPDITFKIENYQSHPTIKAPLSN
jgi:thymidylate synthase